jgi:hypothetical protein
MRVSNQTAASFCSPRPRSGVPWRAWLAAQVLALGLLGLGCGSKPPSTNLLGGGQVFTSEDAGVPDAARSGGTGGPVGGFDLADTEGNGTASSCLPYTCEDVHATCGALADGCGGVLLCGTCTGGNVCSDRSHHCEVPADVCSAVGSVCGLVADACGVGTSCGSCSAGEVCNGRTGQCTCAPAACRPPAPPSVPNVASAPTAVVAFSVAAPARRAWPACRTSVCHRSRRSSAGTRTQTAAVFRAAARASAWSVAIAWRARAASTTAAGPVCRRPVRSWARPAAA